MAKEKKTVSVEMTEDQKEKVIAHLAKEEIKEESKTVDDEMVAVELRVWHKHNGRPYGPGRVVVPRWLGDLLLHNDDNAVQGRIKESMDSKHMLQILQSGKSRPVKVEG